jgi:twitching motility protein PilT
VEGAMNFDSLLKFGVDQGASAIHLQAESSPQLRIGGKIRNVEGPPVGGEQLRAFIATFAPREVVDALARRPAVGSVFSAQVGSVGRFRATTYSHVKGPGLALRVIPATIPTVDELNLPPGVRQIALASRGLVLVVGPAGSGKSTTLAAMIDLINAASYQKIVTLEAPVEHLYPARKALISQMGVGSDVASFDDGVALAMQQDADVIVVGDLNDASTARSVLTAAEAGRKVLVGMNGLFAIQAIGRLIAMILPGERDAANTQFAAALEGVIALRLATTKDGKLRPAVEVLRGGVNTARSILENRIKDLSFFIEGRQGGMQSLDQHLVELYQAGVISGTETMRLASNPEVVAVELRASRPSTEGPRRRVAEEPGLEP